MDLLRAIAVFGLLAAALVLLLGIGTLVDGGKEGSERSTRYMTARVIVQAIAAASALLFAASAHP
jgi:hypothetical protein